MNIRRPLRKDRIVRVVEVLPRSEGYTVTFDKDVTVATVVMLREIGFIEISRAGSADKKSAIISLPANWSHGRQERVLKQMINDQLRAERR